MYVNEIVQWHYVKTYAYEKQSSKVQKMVTPRSISTFSNSTTTYKTSDEKQKTFIDDFVLVVVKGYLF